MRTNLVETPLVGEDGDMSVISSAACREMVLAGIYVYDELGVATCQTWWLLCGDGEVYVHCQRSRGMVEGKMS